MGNCTSKKSGKLSKITLSTLPIGKKMEKGSQGSKSDSRGLSTKIAPSSKGQATSFGFKRRVGSSLPTPVTLTSRVNEMRQDVASGSSVESLCHVANSSSPLHTPKVSASPSAQANRRTPSPGMGATNRFGFRSATPPKGPRQSPGQRGVQTTPRASPGARSKSAVGAREARAAFFKALQPAGSASSILGSQADVADATHPGKFWLQTGQLPRLQYPVRLQDKAYKTHTNNYRRDGPSVESSSKDNSVTDDSGVGTQQSTPCLSDTDNQSNQAHSSQSSQSRGRPARKLELRMVNENKFELLDKTDSRHTPTVFIKAPKTTPNSGLVQQRTQQYLERITGARDSNRTAPLAVCSAVLSPGDSTESEEEKLTKDARRSEKTTGAFLMTDGSGENDEFLPGEAMADDITLSFSSDDDLSVQLDPTCTSSVSRKPVAGANSDAVTIRSDALRLSNQLRRDSDSKSTFTAANVDDSCLLNSEERAVLDGDTLELSSESDTSGEKDNVGNNKPCTILTGTLNTSTGSTDSPGTPSNGSMSEGREFLIDDEIADQPQLCFSTHEDLIVDKVTAKTGTNNNNSEATAPNTQDNRSPTASGTQVRRVSVGTLSPCESLMSDDLMMDFDESEEHIDRCAGSAASVNGDNISLDDQRWQSLPRNKSLGSNVKSVMGGSTGGSPASHRSGVSRASTDEDMSVRLDKGTCQHMFQDIVSIKSMLLKLNKVLSENDSTTGPCIEEDTTADLKRQVSILQKQLEQRESSLQMLQEEVNRAVDRRARADAPTLCNAATQTDKVRPISTGPSIIHNLPSDSNVVTNGNNMGSNRKVAEWIEDNKRQSMVKMAPAEKILEKVKELSFKPVDVIDRERAERRTVCNKNVFKITKIDLVLKSDNYGQNELRKS